ncbi:hypothetical protein A3D85_01995 [Candidatus Amesbacteria bacterium RIFCSPHIGHO2_02_FULL_47_9]|uniref:Methyltransferase type 11 domain-containing protein n=1 Tax=Candidatus Amesbacteria bacterium RIFCSPHIGHO2_01_FULL_48_32b TaxID=1797253 RepID=A0A1F4YDS8_9BACT|nr:MAG: hypothetical protein A2876_02525 [Candidatus Amesbacteria bacterium RIFCSPHIGHO2_01_FULL_48_32b]OGD04536.1 MAG: hypothetical protein A3D85_01995 [Candidatus Amesbacteria bacterium RIFCSPHIGHO2_02_FULL_47_9]OGD08091.1 MAG: hypothetical protein A2899_01970 [Candidatus Amesbacteria bacterium RIFCSPLOWO2_01_FULL_49_25]
MSINWSININNRITPEKSLLSRLSLKVRIHQLGVMLRLFHPSNRDLILDVGLSPLEKLPDTNFFERHYPYPHRLTAASVEDCSSLKKRYPEIKIVKIIPHSRLPFPKFKFEIATSWATLEHVGGYSLQEKLLNELLRVGKHIFVTTPYRYCIYEPHTSFFFIHWLPLSWFRLICRSTDRQFWGIEAHFNPLSVTDIHKMKLTRPVFVKIYKIFGLLPTHLLISDVAF